MATEHKDTLPAQEPVALSETERLKRDIYRPDIEKFRLFTKMLRTNAFLKKAIIHHK